MASHTKYRKKLLAEAPWCNKCGYEPADKSKLDYHHLQAKCLGGSDEVGELLCKSCHNVESAKQRRRHKVIGINGWRVEPNNPFKSKRKRKRKRRSLDEALW